MKHCVRCGIEIKKGAFCYHCGSLPKEDPEEENYEVANWCCVCDEPCKAGKLYCEVCLKKKGTRFV